jgi:2-polyprenyl-3-methyl-5-hydroxy-6-metoxy-1,4-benzoquinol methylase
VSADPSAPTEVLTYEEAVQRVTFSLEAQSSDIAGGMQILEAGCGRRWEIDLGQRKFEITGIDLDAHALEHRQSVVGDINFGVVGSICDPGVVPTRRFDVVYSAYVLEHIDGAQAVLENFVSWARPGGLIVLWLPNRNSVYGWAARHTPYRLHVWVYRYVFRKKGAGQAGFGPYPTHHDAVLAPDALLAFFRSRDLIVEEWFAINTFSHSGLRSAAIRIGMGLVSRLSGGRLSDQAVDLCVVLRVPRP